MVAVICIELSDFQVEQEDLEHQLDDAKRTAKEISRRDTDDTAAEKAKLTELQGAMNQKQELMKRELGATEQLLGADGRRDFAQEEQLEAAKSEAQLLQAIKEAEAEAQRRVKQRNSVVGAVAQNKFGMVIETKQACDQEKGTEWYLGRCLVSGEKHTPETPEEVAAVRAVNEAQSGYDDSLKAIHSKNHSFREADRRLKKAKEEMESYENHHDATSKRAQHFRSQVDDAKATPWAPSRQSMSTTLRDELTSS